MRPSPSRWVLGCWPVGRTIVYEDTTRDLDLRLGKAVIDALAKPLGLLLDSGRWLVEQAANVYQLRFLELYERCLRRFDGDEVPFGALVAAATPDLAFSYTQLPGLMLTLLGEFQERWARILNIPQGASQHRLTASAITEMVSQQFASGPPRWSAAMNHSPDIMIAASDIDAINRDEFFLVLGELHLAVNTLENRCVVEQHPDPGRLLAAAEADHGTRRVVPVPSKQSSLVNSRTYPPALLSSKYTYWCTQPDITGAPARVRPAGETAGSARGRQSGRQVMLGRARV